MGITFVSFKLDQPEQQPVCEDRTDPEVCELYNRPYFPDEKYTTYRCDLLTFLQNRKHLGLSDISNFINDYKDGETNITKLLEAEEFTDLTHPANLHLVEFIVYKVLMLSAKVPYIDKESKCYWIRGDGYAIQIPLSSIFSSANIPILYLNKTSDKAILPGLVWNLSHTGHFSIIPDQVNDMDGWLLKHIVFTRLYHYTNIRPDFVTRMINKLPGPPPYILLQNKEV